MTNAELHGCPYPGWVCFHCGEEFQTAGAAADHFGTIPDRKAACQIKLGEERGLVMALRRAEDERDALAAHAERYLAAYTKLTNAEQTEDADTREIMYLANQELMAEFDAIAGEVPDESLTRLIAKKQAEVLTQASIDTMTAAEAATIRAHLRNRARKFRRQAEGSE